MGRVEKTIDLGIEKMYQVEISPKSGLAVGKVHGVGDRENQQDAFGISNTAECAVEEKGVLLVLADGMGGLCDGEKASMVAVVSCLNYFEQYDIQKEVREELFEMLYQANHQIRAELGANAGAGGSTVIAVRIKERVVSWVSVGDSRLYLFREGDLQQLNREHNYAAQLTEMVANGEISEQEAMAHPQRRALTSYMGMDEILEIDCNEEELVLEKGDRLLIMSDGIFGTLSSEEIIAAMEYPARKAAMHLGMQIERKKKRNQDNYTAIVIETIA